MSVLNRFRPALLLAVVAAGATVAFGQDTTITPASPTAQAPAAPSTGSDRLFLAFSQEAEVVKSQWWEGQLGYMDGSKGMPTDAWILRGVVAFRPVKTLEVGGTFGLGNTNADPGRPDGTGATDLTAYGKWVFVDAVPKTNFAAGLLVTIPTGDDTVGLGFNSFASQAFGSVSYRLENIVVLGGHVGLCINGDGQYQGVELDAKASFEVGFSALFPLANEVSLVAEVQSQTARFDNNNPSPNNLIGAEAATSLLGGINWRAFGRGMLRGEVSVGITEGAPDYTALLSYAYTF